MTLMINQTKLTARRFLMLGEDPPGVRLELIHGEIGVSPSPSFFHSHAVTQLAALLVNHVKEQDLGVVVADIDTIFGEFDVRRPDLLFIAKSRTHLIHGHGIPMSPDLCVEVISPSSHQMDREDKFALYAEHGVLCYWIIDPQVQSFEAFRLEGGTYIRTATGRDNDIVCAAPFGSLAIPLATLWTTLGQPKAQ